MKRNTLPLLSYNKCLRAGSDLAVKQEGLNMQWDKRNKRKNERNGAITFLSHVKFVIIAVI